MQTNSHTPVPVETSARPPCHRPTTSQTTSRTHRHQHRTLRASHRSRSGPAHGGRLAVVRAVVAALHKTTSSGLPGLHTLRWNHQHRTLRASHRSRSGPAHGGHIHNIFLLNQVWHLLLLSTTLLDYWIYLIIKSVNNVILYSYTQYQGLRLRNHSHYK